MNKLAISRQCTSPLIQLFFNLSAYFVVLTILFVVFYYLFFFYLLVVHALTADACVKVRGQLVGIDSLLSMRVAGVKRRLSGWWEVSFPIVSSQLFQKCLKNHSWSLCTLEYPLLLLNYFQYFSNEKLFDSFQCGDILCIGDLLEPKLT